MELPPACPIGLFLYDVATATDNAGTVTEKQNFEWYWNYATQTVEQEGVVSTERIRESIGPSTTVQSHRSR